uniref:DRBM domain-containing protein n=1 Tax=Globodera rostochiensis TaxID=31243 RepID=A0A914HYM2_GLORO
MDSDGAPCFDRQQYYKQIVDHVVREGLHEAHRQRPINQTTLAFLFERKKDPVSMLNIYCTASAVPRFEFFVFQLAPIGASKFLYITELDGRPVYGVSASSKKEAKKACALRVLDNLMAQQRLDCINATGRKVRRAPPKPLPISLNGPADDEQCAQQGYSNVNFSDDIDLDKMQKEFVQLNSVPTDCKEQEVFARLRSTAFKLHSENAFWGHVQLSEETKAKMMQCKLETNPVAFVRRCILLRSLRQPEATVEDSESLKPTQLDFYVFTLPYVPAHYACLAVFNGAIHHGAIAVSKQKAKISCAEVLAEILVKEGWADVKKAAKKRKNIAEDKILKKRRKEDGQREETNARTSHHYLLTLHPSESLDPKTHFLLAIAAKSPIQLLKEIADREKFVLSYAEIVDEATGAFAKPNVQPQGKESTLWSKVAEWPSNWKNLGVFKRRLRVVW